MLVHSHSHLPLCRWPDEQKNKLYPEECRFFYHQALIKKMMIERKREGFSHLELDSNSQYTNGNKMHIFLPECENKQRRKQYSKVYGFFHLQVLPKKMMRENEVLFPSWNWIYNQIPKWKQDAQFLSCMWPNKYTNSAQNSVNFLIFKICSRRWRKETR